jgi:probable addiction module antidote protein
VPIRTYRWDTATHLTTPADVVAYLEAALVEGADDPAFLVEAIGTAARAHGMSRLAAETGVTRRGLYKALGADANPSFTTVYAVLRALGVRIRAEVDTKSRKTRGRRAAPTLAKRPRAPAARVGGGRSG